jgi:hypothetical protein
MRYRFLSLIVLLFSLICILLVLEMSTDMVETVRAEDPSILSITFSPSAVRAGTEPVYIQVNAEDAEDPKYNLTIEDIEWQYNGDEGGEYNGSWSQAYFGASGYDSQGQYIEIPWSPSETATPGYYGFRIKVTDTDGNKSDPWTQILDAVYVGEVKCGIEYVTPETDEVYRGEQLTVRMSGEDVFDPEYDLTPHLEYKGIAQSTWTEITGSSNYNSGGQYWEVYWTPDVTLDLGHYQFQGRFENTDNAFSDYMAGDLDVIVRNNIPDTMNIGIAGSATSVYRDDTITLYANGDDEETPEKQLTAYFEYSAPGDTWDNAYFSGMTYGEAGARWEIDFEPQNDAELGDYSFRVYFKDYDNDNSYPIEMSSTIEVNNVQPEVQDLTVPFSALRGEVIILIANGHDADGYESALIPTFQFRPPTGAWRDFPGTANFVGTSWRMTWFAGIDEDVGRYGFRVRFLDGDDESDWFEERNAFTLENNQPEVDIIAPQRDGTTVSFQAVAFDEEDTEFAMSYEWDFGDGSTSTEPNPSHEYMQSGSYDVTVIVTDSDGDTATDTVFISIPSIQFTSSSLPEPIRFLLLIIFIITVLMTVLMAFIVFKRQGEKRKGEGV